MGRLPRVQAPEPVEIYKGLRERVLTSKPEALGLEGPGPQAYAVLMEIGLSNGLARGRHALSPLFRAGNEVVTQLRLNTEKKER